MAEDEIKKIIEKRELLRQELEKIDNFLELYRELTGPEKAGADTMRVEKVREHYRRRPGTTKPAEIGPMVRDILLTYGKPMTRSELLEALKAHRVALAGEDKARYLGTIMWRMKEAFVNIDGYGYWPRDAECVQVGYSPTEEQPKEVGRLGKDFLGARNKVENSADE